LIEAKKGEVRLLTCIVVVVVVVVETSIRNLEMTALVLFLKVHI
jgi:hypothetical protein